MKKILAKRTLLIAGGIIFFISLGKAKAFEDFSGESRNYLSPALELNCQMIQDGFSWLYQNQLRRGEETNKLNLKKIGQNFKLRLKKIRALFYLNPKNRRQTGELFEFLAQRDSAVLKTEFSDKKPAADFLMICV